MPITRTRLNLRRFLVLWVYLMLNPVAHAWTEGLQEAVHAVASGQASATQQMAVFVHNTEVNLMAQKGVINTNTYTTAQQRFNDLNQKFIQQAFHDSGFVPHSSELKMNPGTDTDVNVTSNGSKIKLEDITSAEDKYQKAIKEHFNNQPGIDKSKVPSGRIDTNTDFMPHPANVDPSEFDKISKHINVDNHGTMYTDPKAASAQAKLGDKAAKLTVEEAGAFSAEIKNLANSKMAAADQARKDAAAIRSSNPGEAERFEAMASNYEYQAAKYHARMTDVNNQLRGQYSLTNKAGSMDDVSKAIANIGRNPYSAAEANMVRSLHAKALQNSADNMIGTMLEIAKKNPSSLTEIRQIIAAESKALSAAGAAKAATRLEDAVKHIEAAAKWSAFKEAAKDLSGFNATTKLSAVMTAGGAVLIGYQGVQIALTEVKANDTFLDFLKNVYIHAGWEGTGMGPAFEGAQKEEIDKYMKEIMAGRDPSMFKHVTFTILKTGVYMGQEALIGVLTLPSTIWEAFTQEKEMEAYAAMQNELAAAMQQMVLDRQAFNAMMTKMKKLGLHPEDVAPFLNCLCRECGGMFGGYYKPAGEAESGRGPCMCSGPLTIWRTPLPTWNMERQYACFNEITKMRYNEAQDIFNKWHQQALNENAQAVAKEFAEIKQEIAKGNLENDEELARRLADQFAAIQPMLLPADADWGKAMIGPHLFNHARKQVQAGNLPRAVENLDKAIDKVGLRGAQNDSDAKQWRNQYKAWDPVWKAFKAKRFPEVDAQLGKRQVQRALGDIAGIEAQLKDPYSRKLPPATMDPDFLRLKTRVEEQQRAYNAAVQDAWKRSSELQKANDPREAAEVLNKIQKEWEHPQEMLNGFYKQVSYDNGLVAKAMGLKSAGENLERTGSLAIALERYVQSVAIQRDAALEAKIGQLQQGQVQGAKLWNEGKALYTSGRPQDALEKFKESVQLWPDAANRNYVNQLEASLAAMRARAKQLRAEGETLQKQNRIREAIAKYRESLKLVPDPLLEQHIQMLERSLQTVAVTTPPVAPIPQPYPVTVPSPNSIGTAGGWEYVGIGDCPGNDIAGGSQGDAPDPRVCDNQHAGLAAVCWDSRTPRALSTPSCTVKSVTAENCRGGANPGRMYRCKPNSQSPAVQSKPGFYLVDLTPYGGKKDTPTTVNEILMDRGSWIRLKHHGEDGHASPKMQLEIAVPAVAGVTSVALNGNLDHAHLVPQGATITRMTVLSNEGAMSFDIKAGVHMSEWNGPNKHQVAPTGSGSSYTPVFTLPRAATVTGLRFDYVEVSTSFDHEGSAPGFCLRGVTLVGQSSTPVSTQSPNAPAAGVLYENGNTGGVYNLPTQATTFTLSRVSVVTLIQNYHWNDGKGTVSPGTIGLRDDAGRVFGPWPTTGSPGQGGVPNANWAAHPNVQLPAGRYTVIDSNPATWAQNSGTKGAGMTRIEGH